MIPTYAHLRVLAWATAGICLVGGVRSWDPFPSETVPEQGSSVGPPAEAPSSPPSAPADLNGAARLLSDRNPFRFERRPTDVRFGLSGPIDESPTDDGAGIGIPVSALALEGFIEGTIGTAVISGVPDFPRGVVITVGETRGGVTLVALRNDSAVISVAGGTVALGLKEVGR